GKNIRDRRARKDGLQINSIAGEFLHGRCKTPSCAADSSVEAAQRASWQIVPSTAKLHARHHWQESRDGKFSRRIQASSGLNRFSACRIVAMAKAGQRSAR